MTTKRGFFGLALAGSVLVAAGMFFLAGCMSVDNAISNAVAKQIAPAPAAAPAPQAQPAPQQQASSGGGSAMAYQYQFGAFYGGFWNMGWYGYKDANYKPGQGTVWTFTSDKKSSDVLTLERALLKVNADSSQWWRLKMDTGKQKDTVIYEFLVGTDGVVQKVRYKDPDSGSVQEFVPSQSGPQPATGSTAAPMSRADMAKYKVDKQTVTVKGGSFATDHFLYTDPQSNGTAEQWVSTTVPGGMVKSIYMNKKDKATMTGELIQIESGVATTLGSY